MFRLGLASESSDGRSSARSRLRSRKADFPDFFDLLPLLLEIFGLGVVEDTISIASADWK